MAIKSPANTSYLCIHAHVNIGSCSTHTSLLTPHPSPHPHAALRRDWRSGHCQLCWGNHVWLCNALVASCSLMYVLGQLKLIYILLDDTGTTHHVLLDIISRGVTPLRQTCFDTIQVAKFTVPHITSS